MGDRVTLNGILLSQITSVLSSLGFSSPQLEACAKSLPLIKSTKHEMSLALPPIPFRWLVKSTATLQHFMSVIETSLARNEHFIRFALRKLISTEYLVLLIICLLPVDDMFELSEELTVPGVDLVLGAFYLLKDSEQLLLKIVIARFLIEAIVVSFSHEGCQRGGFGPAAHLFGRAPKLELYDIKLLLGLVDG